MSRETVRSDIGSLWDRIRTFFFHDLWQFDLGPRSLTASLVRLLQFSVMVAQGFVSDRLLLRASALTFVTALSTIPLLVVVVALIGLVGGQESLIDAAVGQLAAVSPEANRWIVSRIQEVHIGSLGTLGGATLVLSAVLALRHLESTLGDIWGVRQNRSWPRRFADYLAVLVVAPLLMGVGLSLATSVKSQWVVRQLLEDPLFRSAFNAGLRELPTFLMAGAFCFLYWFMPNTRVRFSAALVGGIFAALSVNTALAAYVGLSVGVARAQALYGVFAQLPLLFVWIYVFWAIALLGAEIVFAVQNLAHYRREVRVAQRSPADREALGLRVAVEVARRFRDGGAPADGELLSETLDVPVRSVREVSACLVEAGLLARQSLAHGGEYLGMARPVSAVRVADVLDALRGSRADSLEAGEVDAVAQTLGDLDTAIRNSVGARSLEELVDEGLPEPGVDLIGARG